MSAFTAGFIIIGWMFSFCLISFIAMIGATHSPNPDAIIYVWVTVLVNATAFAVLMHHYLKLKYLCDKFIEG
mgnify:CR=1 FL=1